MDRSYKNDKIMTFVNEHGFFTVVSPKKIVSYLGTTINTFINSATILNDIF